MKEIDGIPYSFETEKKGKNKKDGKRHKIRGYNKSNSNDGFVRNITLQSILMGLFALESAVLINAASVNIEKANILEATFDYLFAGVGAAGVVSFLIIMIIGIIKKTGTFVTREQVEEILRAHGITMNGQDKEREIK